MPIYEQKYQPWSGKLRSHFWCVFSITWLGLTTALKRRSVQIVLGLAFVSLFIWLGILILAGEIAGIGGVGLGNSIYWVFLDSQMGFFVWLLAAIAGGGLIANDIRMNAISMYFSKAITRLDYIIGKLGTIFILLWFVTFVPSSLLFIARVKQESDAAAEVHKEQEQRNKDLEQLDGSGRPKDMHDTMRQVMNAVRQKIPGRTFPTFWDHLRDLLAIAGHSFVLAFPISLVILAFSSLTKRPLFAALGWIAFAFLTDGVSQVMLTAAVTSRHYEHRKLLPEQADGVFPFDQPGEFSVEAAKGTASPDLAREWPKLISLNNNLRHLGRQFYPSRPVIQSDWLQISHEASAFFDPVMRVPWWMSLLIVGVLCGMSYFIIHRRLRYIEGS